MASGKHDFVIQQGATNIRVARWYDVNGDLVDLTTYTGAMQVRRTIDSPDVLLTLTTENGGITLGGALGTITLNITSTVSTLLPVGKFVYDLEMTSATPIVTRLLEGAFTVTAEVTR